MKVPSTAMILTAGRGTRMGALTTDRPKPLLPVAGSALVDYVLERLAVAGVRRLVANLHHHADQLRDHLSSHWQGELLFSDESDCLLETGGGVKRALPLLGGNPFFVVNGDALWFDDDGAALVRLAKAFDRQRMSGLLLLQPREKAIAYDRAGDFDLDERGRIGRGGAFVFTGVQVLTPAMFEGSPDGPFSLNLVYDREIERGRMFGLEHAGAWIEVNRPEGLAAAEAALAAP